MIAFEVTHVSRAGRAWYCKFGDEVGWGINAGIHHFVTYVRTSQHNTGIAYDNI